MDRPWLAHYPPNVDWYQAFEPRPVHAALDSAAAQWQDNIHLDFFGREFSYRQVLEMVGQAAKACSSWVSARASRWGCSCPTARNR